MKKPILFLLFCACISTSLSAEEYSVMEDGSIIIEESDCSEGPIYYTDCSEEPVFYTEPSPCYEEPIYYDAPFYSGDYNSFLNPPPPQSIGQFISNSLCKNIGVEISALYWKTARDDRTYAFNNVQTGPDNFSFFYGIVKPAFHWGWRVKAQYRLPCCSFFDVDYTNFKQSDRDITRNPSAITIVSFFGSATQEISAQITTKYQRAKARLGWYLCNGAKGSFYVTGGGSWIRISESDRLTPAPSTVPVFLTQQSVFDGGSVEAGVGGKFNFLNCLGIKAELTGIGAIGNIKNREQLATTISGPLVINTNRYPNITRLVPGLDICVEIFLAPNFCLPLTIAVGYEHHHFFNVLRLIDLFGLGGSDKFTLHYDRDIGFGGPYVSLKFNY